MKTKDKQKAKAAPASDNNVAVKIVAGATETSTPISKKKSVAKKTDSSSTASLNKTVKSPKKLKPNKIKMVRDSFTMPENDYANLAVLKKKCLEAGVHVKKSELLRAGLLCLSKLGSAALIKEVEHVEVIKTGRPAAV